MGRIVSKEEIIRIIQEDRRDGKRIVFTNGCFDILHRGHVELLRRAREAGDTLIVGLNSDRSILRIKKKSRPVIDERSRSVVLSSIIYVDYVVLFDEPTPRPLIKLIKPDVLVKGEDWEEDEIVGKEFSGKVIRVNLVPGYSTTEIIDKIRNL